MNIVKILHAVRSAITEIAELLVVSLTRTRRTTILHYRFYKFSFKNYLINYGRRQKEQSRDLSCSVDFCQFLIRFRCMAMIDDDDDNNSNTTGDCSTVGHHGLYSTIFPLFQCFSSLVRSSYTILNNDNYYYGSFTLQNSVYETDFRHSSRTFQPDLVLRVGFLRVHLTVIALSLIHI